MNKSWRTNAQHSEYSQQYYSTKFIVTKRLDLNLFPPQKRNDNCVMC